MVPKWFLDHQEPPITPRPAREKRKPTFIQTRFKMSNSKQLVWQCQVDGGAWETYDESAQALICAAAAAGRSTVCLFSASTQWRYPYTLDLRAMRQTKAETSASAPTARRIRLTVAQYPPAPAKTAPTANQASSPSVRRSDEIEPVATPMRPPVVAVAALPRTNDPKAAAKHQLVATRENVFPPPVHAWECRNCCYRNLAGRAACLMCNTVPPPPPPLRAAKKASSWFGFGFAQCIESQ
jgi:hypothetical protein